MRMVIFFSAFAFGVASICFDSSAQTTKPNNSGAETALLSSLHVTFAENTDEVTLKLVKDNRALIKAADDSKCTALHYAARYARPATATWLLEQGADVNTHSYNQFTPMHVVADAATARVLIKAGADLTATDAWGKTPLQNAAQMERKDVCDAILDSGFKIDLRSALWLGQRDEVKRLLKDTPAIAKQVEQGADLWGDATPLGIAAGKGDKEIVELLLKAGAPVNGETDRPNAGGSSTALTNAVLGKHYEIAEMLCKAGANCNVVAGKFYPRLLDYAEEHSEPRMVELLKKYGAERSEPLKRRRDTARRRRAWSECKTRRSRRV